MRRPGWFAALSVQACVGLVLSGCGGGGGSTHSIPASYVLTVNSTNPASGVAISYGNPNNSLLATGNTSFTVSESAGTALVLTAPATAGSNKFSSWTGCTTASTTTCNITVSAAQTVTANYTGPAVTAISVTPSTATIGSQVQFAAAVSGTGSYSSAVTWSVAAPAGSALTAGTMSSAGLLTTPYPAPATVTVTATSVEDPSVSGTATVTLTQPAPLAGLTLSVDAGSQTHAINPDIYGMDAYLMNGTAADIAAVAPTNITIDLWGGDGPSATTIKWM